jgi:tRNA(Met) C34 N-acetyltransferase TmcA
MVSASTHMVPRTVHSWCCLGSQFLKLLNFVNVGYLFGKFAVFIISLYIGRLFRKIELSESIRYASRDPIESWLNALLCLDVANSIPSISRSELSHHLN